MNKMIIGITVLALVFLGTLTFGCPRCSGGERYLWQPPALCGTPLLRDETLKLYKKYGRPSRIPSRVLTDLGRLDAFGRPVKASVGDQETFWTNSWVTNQFYQITATLQKVGTHCYIYVEDGQTVSSTVIDDAANEFDTNIYPTDTSIFGSEPDVDGDPRITILLMDIRDGYNGSGGFVAGYFHSLNEYNSTHSNLREMFYMDVNPGQPGTTQFYGTLAHEFQHMIHFNQDGNEETWVNEGCSTLAEYLCGYGHDSNIGDFLNSPDDGLISWGGALADYGQVYLFLYYLWEKYGGDSFISYLTQNQQNGIQGVNSSLAAEGYSDDFKTVFSNWAVANYLDSPSIGDGKYGYTGLDLTSFSPGGIYLSNTWSSYPVTSSGSVNYYAADYLKFTNGNNLTFSFNGDDSNKFRMFLIDESSLPPQLTEVLLNSSNDGTSSNFTSFSSLVMIPVSVSSSGGKNYSYSTAGTPTSSAKIQIKSFTSNLTTSTSPNTAVTFTVDAEGETGSPLYYKFLEKFLESAGNWNILQNFYPDNSITWYPASSGNYIIVVHVSDNPTTPPDPIPQAGLSCEVSQGTSSVQVRELTTDLHFAAPVNQPVRIQADAQGNGAQYEFFVSPYSINKNWTTIQEWSPNAGAQWTPLSPGNYILVVHTAQDPLSGWDNQIGLTLTICDKGGGTAAIIPGQQMAGVKVGDTYASVVSLYGPPEGTDYDTDYFVTYCYYYSQGVAFVIDDTNMDMVVDNNELVFMIITVAPYTGKTAGENGIGSTLSSVRSELGLEEAYDSTNDTYWYRSQGIVFTVSGNTVIQIAVFEPVFEAEGDNLIRALLVPRQ